MSQDVKELHEAVRQLFFAVCTLYEVVQERFDEQAPPRNEDESTGDSHDRDAGESVKAPVHVAGDGGGKDRRVKLVIIGMGAFLAVLLFILVLSVKF